MPKSSIDICGPVDFSLDNDAVAPVGSTSNDFSVISRKLAKRLANTVPSYAFFPFAEGADPRSLDEALVHGLGGFTTEPVESMLTAATEDAGGLLKSIFGQM